MQVTSEQLDPCKISLKIEVEPERVAKAYETIYREFGKATKVPGFRPGKAPRTLVEKYVSAESVRREVVDLLVTEVYPQAVEQEKIEPYASPEVDIEQLEEGKPLIFTAAVPLPPKIELGDYKGIEAVRPKVEITDADVDAQLEYLQNQRVTAEKVEDRGVQESDIVIAEMSQAQDGEEMSEPKRSLIHMGQNAPGFDEHVMGLKPGERKSFDVTYPEDFDDKELAGKKVKFDVSVESIRERKVPELNDEFAKQIGTFETMDALKADIREHLTQARESDADRDVEQAIIEGILGRSEVHIPDVLVEHEMGHDLQEMQQSLSRQNATLDQYLQSIGKDREEFVKELRESASRRVKIGLVLGEVSEKENLDVTEQDVDAEIERMAEESKTTLEAVNAYVESRGGKSSLLNQMLNRKILDFLRSVSSIKTE